jgi:hypothetical protein
MAHGTVQFQTDNIFIQAPKATLNNELTVEGNGIYRINFNNEIYFNRETYFYSYAYFPANDGNSFKPQLQLKTENVYGSEHAAYFYFRDYDTFWHFRDPIGVFNMYYYGSNHIIQFKVMTQEELSNYRLERIYVFIRI